MLRIQALGAARATDVVGLVRAGVNLEHADNLVDLGVLERGGPVKEVRRDAAGDARAEEHGPVGELEGLRGLFLLAAALRRDVDLERGDRRACWWRRSRPPARP